jgi:hypothetical protein
MHNIIPALLFGGKIFFVFHDIPWIFYHEKRVSKRRYLRHVNTQVIFYCYSRGIITSRPIEYACKTNIIVKALARDAEPDHDTVAHFISSQAPAVKDFFAQVLLKCYAPGLTGGELFAIDGCKLPSNAAREWSGTLEELGKKKKDLETLMGKIIAQHIQSVTGAVRSQSRWEESANIVHSGQETGREPV